MFDFIIGFVVGVVAAPAFKKYAWPRLEPKLAALMAKVW